MLARAEFQCELQHGRICRREICLPIVGNDTIEALFGRAKQFQGLIVEVQAVSVVVRRGERQQNAFFLSTRESLIREKYGGDERSFRLNHPWQKGLGAEEARHETELFGKNSKGLEGRPHIHFSKVAHLSTVAIRRRASDQV